MYKNSIEVHRALQAICIDENGVLIEGLVLSSKEVRYTYLTNTDLKMIKEDIAVISKLWNVKKKKSLWYRGFKFLERKGFIRVEIA